MRNDRSEWQIRWKQIHSWESIDDIGIVSHTFYSNLFCHVPSKLCVTIYVIIHNWFQFHGPTLQLPYHIRVPKKWQSSNTYAIFDKFVQQRHLECNLIVQNFQNVSFIGCKITEVLLPEERDEEIQENASISSVVGINGFGIWTNYISQGFKIFIIFNTTVAFIINIIWSMIIIYSINTHYCLKAHCYYSHHRVCPDCHHNHRYQCCSHYYLPQPCFHPCLKLNVVNRLWQKWKLCQCRR